MNEHFIEESNLSIAWGRAIKLVSAPGKKEYSPLIVSVTGFDPNGVVSEDTQIRSALDGALVGSGRQNVETVAGTIFPYNMWNQQAPRSKLYERYNRALPRIRAASTKNKFGIYFERMITGGPANHPNQLEFIIKQFRSRSTVRRSMMQIGIFNPVLDITTAAQRGFPCLQHVTFAPINGELTVNAFYATQYMVERAYGNYLGLCRLGQFAAKEMNLKLARVTCYTGIAMFDGAKKTVTPVMQILNSKLNAQNGSAP